MKLIFLFILLSLKSYAAPPVIPAATSIASNAACTAPCALRFDASGTTDADLTDAGDNKNRAFRELEYMWTFGDSNAGTWTNSPSGIGSVGAINDKSANVAYGPIAAHVYNNPGTYTWSLRVCDLTNCVFRTGTKIVLAWSDAIHGATLCVANGSTPVIGQGGCPADATAVLNSDTVSPVDDYKTIMTTAFGPNGCGTGITCMRVLLRRGDTFVSGTSWTWGDYSGRVLDAYGTGARPIISHGNVHVNNPNTSMASVFKVLNMHYIGGTTTSSGICFFPTSNPIAVHIQGVICESTGGGVSATAGGYLANAFVIDSWFHSCRARNPFFGFQLNTAVMGNVVGPNINPSTPTSGTSSCEHLVRIQGGRGGVVSNNTLIDPSNNKTFLTLRAADHTTGSSEDNINDTKHMVISENKFIADRNCTGCSFLQLAPSGNSQCHWGYDIVVERNWFVKKSTNTVSVGGINTEWRRIDIRNNLYTGFSANTDLNGGFFAVGNGQYSPMTASISNGSPAVITYTGSDSNYASSLRVHFFTDGALPSGISASPQLYYMKNVNTAAKTFEISLTPGGPSINTTTAGSGNHTVTQTCSDTTVNLADAIPTPSNVYVYNNTFYSKATLADLFFATINGASNSGAVKNQIGKNNLAYAPNITNRTFLPYVLGDYLTGFDWPISSNTTDKWNFSANNGANQFKLTDPFNIILPTNETTATPQHFAPTTTSGYPVDTGTAFDRSPANFDYNHCWNKTRVSHQGAFVPKAKATCVTAP